MIYVSTIKIMRTLLIKHTFICETVKSGLTNVPRVHCLVDIKLRKRHSVGQRRLAAYQTIRDVEEKKNKKSEDAKGRRWLGLLSVVEVESLSPDGQRLVASTFGNSVVLHLYSACRKKGRTSLLLHAETHVFDQMLV